MKHWKLKALIAATTLGLAITAGAQSKNYYDAPYTNSLPGTSKQYPEAPKAGSDKMSNSTAQSKCEGLTGTERSDCLRNNSDQPQTGQRNNNPSGPMNSSGPSDASGTVKAGGGEGGNGSGAGTGGASGAGTGGQK
jgi:hypothetical protein